MKTIAQKSAHNMQDVMKNGPRLSYNRNTWIEAVSECEKYVCVGGLGCMGCGTMWREKLPLDEANPEFKDAPRVKIPDYELRHIAQR